MDFEEEQSQDFTSSIIRLQKTAQSNTFERLLRPSHSQRALVHCVPAIPTAHLS